MSMMILASSSSGQKSYFWTGMLLGATLTALGITYWDDFYALFGSRSRPKTKETPFTRGMHMLQKTSTKSLRGLLNNKSFLTSVLEQLWPYMKVAGADSIRTSVEPSFADLPGPMKTCRFTKIDLGDVPLRMDNIIVHPLQPDGSVQFDLDLEWDGECDFRLKADFIGTFGIKHLKLKGRMAIILKPLTNDLPVVSGIQYAFINLPTIDLSFSGLASVADLAILETTVQDALKSSLASSVLPYRRLYKMSVKNNFLDTYQPPLGVLRLNVESGKGFVIEKKLFAKDDIPDVYLKITLGNMPEVWKTSTVMDNLNPEWNELGDYCLYDREQVISLEAWDEDDGPLDPDDELGLATVGVNEMLMSPQRTVTLPLIQYNKKKKRDEDTGAELTISCDLCPWTADLSSLEPNATKSGICNQICGLLVVIVNRAFDIPLERKKACTYVKVSFDGKEYPSKMIYDYPGWDALNPCYDTGITIPITKNMPRGNLAEVKLELIQSEKHEEVLGSIVLNFATLKKNPNNTITERRQIGSKGAILEFRVSLSGVQDPPPKSLSIPDSVRTSQFAAGSSMSTRTLAPIKTDKKEALNDGEGVGMFRLTIVQARGLQIREEFFGFDVPDAYCEVHFGDEVYTTAVQHNSVAPVWNESKELRLKDPGQFITIKLWDRSEREEDPDICVGTVKTSASKILLDGGASDVELINAKGRRSGVIIALRGDMVE